MVISRPRAGSAGVLTAPFDINAGPAFRVAFLETPPDTPVGSPMDAFRVAVLDRWDNFVVHTDHDVTIEIDSLDPFGRDVLLHASGEEIFEFVDCEGPYVLAPEQVNPPLPAKDIPRDSHCYLFRGALQELQEQDAAA